MHTLLKAIVGSQAYGTATPASDEDYKGIYLQPVNEIIGFHYKEQINVSKDECYYEIKRFLELAQSANPTILELLYLPPECILQSSEAYSILVKNRSTFLTKKCLHSFGGYAIAQIKKARGLDKKMNWEKERIVRKNPMDFCHVYLSNGASIELTTFLEQKSLLPTQCGLTAVTHFRDCYALYYDDKNTHGYKGISIEESNTLRLSSIPKQENSIAILCYNKDAYSIHCKEYKSYIEWLENRNTQRYTDIAGHQQQIDGKNLLHCRRLLDMALEIATTQHLHVKRPNAAYLLSIRRGEVDLESLIGKAEEDILYLNELYESCTLPVDIDKDFAHNLLLEIRDIYQ